MSRLSRMMGFLNGESGLKEMPELEVDPSVIVIIAAPDQRQMFDDWLAQQEYDDFYDNLPPVPPGQFPIH